MARTDPPTIKLKRSVLRRVITTKLEALRRGDFYVRNHLGPECYDPIVAEAKSFLDSQQQQQNPQTQAQNPPQDPSPSLSEDFETFVQIIAASILIDASMRGENAGESDPRFIKKKKKLLTKTLRGVKFNEFIHNVWRYDCLRRGMTVPEEPEETEEDTTESNNSSEEEEEEEDEHDDSDQDNTSVTSHTSADGFSTSASNSKRHHHGSSSSSKRKRHKKEKKKLKKEKRQRRREERRRRKEEKRLKKLAEKEKKKKKRKKEEEEEDDEHEVGVPREAGVSDKDDKMEACNGKSDESYNNNNNAEDEESYYEIEHATKEEFEAFREDILSKIPKKVKRRFREGGFSRWGKDWLPVLEIGPFDVEPGPVRRMWMEMFHNVSS
ncbi:hypothetical protein HJC23_013617 [Cyclotella cryptica]|uniref:Uncharacterized protein n=1 Tax=Cyclotella cryptica TaxID=29204 RepID=A0ABD3PQX7_9STRA